MHMNEIRVTPIESSMRATDRSMTLLICVAVTGCASQAAVQRNLVYYEVDPIVAYEVTPVLDHCYAAYPPTEPGDGVGAWPEPGETSSPEDSLRDRLKQVQPKQIEPQDLQPTPINSSDLMPSDLLGK